jgi:hypothetical protein
MNVSILHRAKLTAVALALGASCCLVGPRLWAGDPIDFSGGRGKSSAPKESKMDEERLKGLQNSTRTSILREGAPPDSIPSITNPRDPRDPREERRQRLAREERKYFLLYEPGELQKKDSEGKDTGLGNYSLGGRDQKTVGRNWLSEETSSTSKPAASKGAANRKDDRSEDLENRNRQTEESEGERKRSDRLSLSSQSRDLQVGNQAARESDFKDLLNSTQARGEAPSSFDKADFTLRDMLGTTETTRTRAQETRMDSFRQMLNGTTAKDAARLPGANPPSDRAFNNFSKPGGAFTPPAAAGPDFGTKPRVSIPDNTYQRPSPFQNAATPAFNPSDPSKARVQPADFESLKKRMR